MSGLSQGSEFDVAAATSGSGETGVPHGAVLVALVDAAMARDDDALEAARRDVIGALGAAALSEAAAVVATFNQMVRIADATGIALDAPLDIATQGLREEIGVAAFGSSSNTPAPGRLKRAFGLVLDRATRPIQPALLRAMARRNVYRDPE